MHRCKADFNLSITIKCYINTTNISMKLHIILICREIFCFNRHQILHANFVRESELFYRSNVFKTIEYGVR